MVAFNRSGIMGTVVVLVVIGTCVRLGIWQLDRLEQRRDRNADVSQRMEAAPLPLVVLPLDTAGLVHRRIGLEGELDHGRSIVLRGRTHRGMPGVHLITPLRLGDGRSVVVNRGWIPAPDGRTVDLRGFEPDGPARFIGLVLPFPLETTRPDASGATGAPAQPGDSIARAWLRLDAGALRRSLPYPLADVYVQALPGEGASTVPARLPAPTLDDGPHLSYAVQWFGFAAVALFGWVALVLRRAGGRRHDGSRDGATAGDPRDDHVSAQDG